MFGPQKAKHGPDAARRGRDHRAQQRQLCAGRTGHREGKADRRNKKALVQGGYAFGMGNLRGHGTNVSEVVVTEVADVN